MSYLRRFADFPTDPAVHQPEFLAHTERCSVVKGGIPAQSQADPLHRHPMDQFYFVLEGSVGVQLGTERFTAGRETLVRVPRGTPHYAFNDGGEHAIQVELLIPTPVPASGGKLIELRELVDDPGGPPPSGCVRGLTDAGWLDPTGTGDMELQPLANRSTGSDAGLVAAVRVPGSTPQPGFHVHAFDELLFVLDGTITVEIGFDRYEVSQHDLIIFPAGVPHRAWNEGPRPERHLTIITPEPESPDVRGWAIDVDFAAAASAV